MPRLYVSGVERYGQREIEQIFNKYGKVKSVQTGSAGFAFVEMETERDCEEAIRSLDKKNIDGKLIRVEMAKGKTREHRENNRDFLCYNCNKPGHLARDCKEKPRNPMYADTRGTKITDLSSSSSRNRFHPYDRGSRYDEPRGRYSPLPPSSRGYYERSRYESPNRGRNEYSYGRTRSPERSYGKYDKRYDSRDYDYMDRRRPPEPYPDYRPSDIRMRSPRHYSSKNDYRIPPLPPPIENYSVRSEHLRSRTPESYRSGNTNIHLPHDKHYIPRARSRSPEVYRDYQIFRSPERYNKFNRNSPILDYPDRYSRDRRDRARTPPLPPPSEKRSRGTIPEQEYRKRTPEQEYHKRTPEQEYHKRTPEKEISNNNSINNRPHTP
jgi:arginine/serine-rich splicing factor 7